MDEGGFYQYLLGRGLPAEQIPGQIETVARFERHLGTLSPQQAPETVDAEAALDYAALLVAEGGNTEGHLLALARYGRFVRNDALFVAILGLWDGAEVMENMARRVGQVLGEDARAEIVPEVPPMTASRWEKARVTRGVMQRLEARLDANTGRAIFSESFRDLPESEFAQDRERYYAIGDLDRYLEIKRREFVAELEALHDRGELFYDQEITDEVIDLVRGDPEISDGVRRGSLLYVTKIPYRAREYLAATDPQEKRYAYCHCPWARESLRQAEGPVSATFCRCSAGYHKRPWEVIFGQPLEADILETVLRGDLRCRFAIHLPPGAPGIETADDL